MKKISSSITPFVKHIIPWTIILILGGGIIASAVGGNFYLTLTIIVFGVPIIGFMRSMFMNLKHVTLDAENNILIVEADTNELVPYEEIRQIFLPSTPPYIWR